MGNLGNSKTKTAQQEKSWLHASYAWCAGRMSFAVKTTGVFMLFVVLAVIGIAGFSEDTARANTSIEADQINRINSARRSSGVSAVRTSDCLTDAARSWSRSMASRQKLAHSSSVYGSISNLVNRHCQSGGTANRFGENVGRGPSSYSIFRAFVNSDGHNRNMLDSSWNMGGVGAHVDADGRVWITQLFVRCIGCGGDWTGATSTSAISTAAAPTPRATLQGLRARKNVSPGWTSVLAGNLDGDRDDELIFYRKSIGRFSVYEGSLYRLGLKHSDRTIANIWDSVAAGNLDGDRDDELIFYRKSDGLLIRYEGSPRSLGTRYSRYNISRGWDNVITADLNGDNKDQLLFHRKSDGRLLAYEGSTSRLGAKHFSKTISRSWDVVVAADVTNNGRDELLLYRKSDGLINIHSASKSGLGAKLATLRITQGWDFYSADLDGDQDDELVFYRPSSGSFVVYEGLSF